MGVGLDDDRVQGLADVAAATTPTPLPGLTMSHAADVGRVAARRGSVGRPDGPRGGMLRARRPGGGGTGLPADDAGDEAVSAGVGPGLPGGGSPPLPPRRKMLHTMLA